MVENGDTVDVSDSRLSPDAKIEQDYVVSFGYGHILKGPLLDNFAKRILNLHISLLPWNRGCDPNFWSFFDETPKGVTLHFIDSGIDTGEIVMQHEVNFSDNETLASSYAELWRAAVVLFSKAWPNIRKGCVPATLQSGTGSFHKRGELNPYFSQLSSGWNTSARELIQLGRKVRRARLAS